MRFGTEEQKSFFLPKILSGEMNFAIGYTEPGAGTDLASLRTRAVRDGDEYVINGAKIFTSGADQADYVWLACRTDPEAPKHKGISIICVPTDHARLRVEHHPHRGRPDHHGHLLRGRAGAGRQPGGRGERGVADDHHPAQPRAGGPGRLERVSPQLFDEVVAWAAEPTTDDGRRSSTSPGCRWTWPGAEAELEAMCLLNWRMAAAVAAGELDGGRVLFHQGLRHRADHRDLPAAAGHRGGGRLPGPGLARGRCCGGASRLRAARPRSTPSAAG